MVNLWTSLAEAGFAVARSDKLPPPTRAAVLMALLGIALVGLLLIVGILLGGHWVRRQGYRRGPSVPPDRPPIITKQAAPDPPTPNASPGAGDVAKETVIGDASSGKTVQQ